MRCADCGRKVEPYVRGRVRRWVYWKNNRRNFACRVNVIDGVLHSADYHYVDGETQRHYPMVLDTASSK